MMNPRTTRIALLLVLNTVAVLLSSLSTDLLSASLQQNLFDSGFSTLAILGIVVIFAVCNGFLLLYPNLTMPNQAGIQRHPKTEEVRPSIGVRRHTAILPFLIYGVVGLIVIGVALVIIFSMINPLTVYFVLDTTSQMEPLFPQASEEISKVLAFQSSNVQIGLRTYGAPTQSSGLCPIPNTFQQIQVGSLSDKVQKFGDIFGSLVPDGNGSMTTAVLEAINQDLKDIRGRIRLIVISAGLDPLCDASGGGTLESLSLGILQERPEIDLSILRIGEPDPFADTIYRQVSGVFGGKYFVVEVGKLEAAIQGISSYGGNYFEDLNQ